MPYLSWVLKAAEGILAYLKTFPKGSIIVNTTYQTHFTYPIEDHPNWKDFYPGSEKEIPNDLPKWNCLCGCRPWNWHSN
jgi:hypothetical protein